MGSYGGKGSWSKKGVSLGGKTPKTSNSSKTRVTKRSGNSGSTPPHIIKERTEAEEAMRRSAEAYKATGGASREEQIKYLTQKYGRTAIKTGVKAESTFVGESTPTIPGDAYSKEIKVGAHVAELQTKQHLAQQKGKARSLVYSESLKEEKESEVYGHGHGVTGGTVGKDYRLSTARDGGLETGKVSIKKDQGLWERANIWLAERTTKPVGQWLRKKGLDKKSLKEYVRSTSPLSVSEETVILGTPQIGPVPGIGLKAKHLGFRDELKPNFIKEISEKKAEAETGYILGFAKRLEERPLTAVAVAGTTAVLPGVGYGVAKVSHTLKFTPFLVKAKRLIPSTVKTIGKVIKSGVKYGFPASYAGFVGVRVSKGENIGQKAEILGGITSTEVVPMLVGGHLGSKLWTKLRGYAVTAGRKEIKVERLVPKKVLEGKETFPTAPKEKHLSLFEKKSYALPGAEKPMGYHATGYRMTLQRGKLLVEEGASELPGLYVSHGVSTHFTRLGAPTKGYGSDFFPKIPSSKVLAVTPEKFVQAGVKTGKGGYAWTINVRPDIAYVPSMKTEVEAILPPGSHLHKVGSRFFMKISGIKVPIDEFATVTRGGEMLVTTKGLSPIGKSVSLSDYSVAFAPVTSPGGYSVALISGGRVPAGLSFIKSSKVHEISQSVSGISVMRSRPSSRPPSIPPSIRPPPSRPPSIPPSIRSSPSRTSSISPSIPPSIRPPPSKPPSIPPSIRPPPSRPPSILPGMPPSIPPGMPPFFPVYSSKLVKQRKRIKIKIKQPKMYMPTVRAAFVGIKGMPTVGAIKSGLGTRPIRKEKKRKKLWPRW